MGGQLSRETACCQMVALLESLPLAVTQVDELYPLRKNVSTSGVPLEYLHLGQPSGRGPCTNLWLNHGVTPRLWLARATPRDDSSLTRRLIFGFQTPRRDTRFIASGIHFKLQPHPHIETHPGNIHPATPAFTSTPRRPRARNAPRHLGALTGAAGNHPLRPRLVVPDFHREPR